MTAARFAPLVLTGLCLSACAGGPASEAVGRYPATASPGGEVAMASLPAAAGRVVAVRNTRHGNGVAQEIVLEGPRTMTGENRITVEALTSAGFGDRAGDGAALRIGPATDTEIAAEMEARLPGVPMRIASSPERDALGPFGYALGATGRLTCIYAWQYVAPSRPLSLFEGASDTGTLPLSLRVRLCRDQPASALVDAVRRLTTGGPGGGGGDALAAAIGPLQVSEERAAAVEEPAPHRTSAGIRHRSAAAPARRRRPALALAGHRPAEARRAVRREPDASASPRLPLPGEVARAGATATRAAAVDPESLPLPR